MRLPHDPFREEADRSLFEAGEAAGYLMKAGGVPESVYALKGRLYLSSSGWLLLDVPNPIVRGLFSALDVPGAELPPARGGFYRAHISVMDSDETAKIGPDQISERGKLFAFNLGPLQVCEPDGWKEMSKVYFVRILSPALKALRCSYGLTPLLRGHEFHASVAVVKKNALRANGRSKAADVDERGEPCPDGECCNRCNARLERGDDGRCNRCGEAWPEKAAADRNDDPEYLAESAAIKVNRMKPASQKPHKFEEAEWTHPNGHPRCLKCGDEPRGDGTGEPYDLCTGYDPTRNKQSPAVAITRARRIAKHDRRVAKAHNPRIRAFGREHGFDVSSILLPEKAAMTDDVASILEKIANPPAGLTPALAKWAPTVIGLSETAADTAGSAINNPEHPWRSAGRALVTGLGTTAGMAGGAYLGGKYGPQLGMSSGVGSLAGTAAGAIAGGIGGAGLARMVVPQGEPDDREKEAFLAVTRVIDNLPSPSVLC